VAAAVSAAAVAVVASPAGKTTRLITKGRLHTKPPFVFFAPPLVTFPNLTALPSV
jgi:hypothetical protein